MTSGATMCGENAGIDHAGDDQHDQRDAQRDGDDDERLGTRRETLGEEQHRSHRESQKPGEQNPRPRGVEQHTERRREEAVCADPLRARERRGRPATLIDLSPDPCGGPRPAAGDADDPVDHVDLIEEIRRVAGRHRAGLRARPLRRRTRGSMSGRRSPGLSACHSPPPGLRARRGRDPRGIRCRSWPSRVRPSSPAPPGPGPSPQSPRRCGAGAPERGACASATRRTARPRPALRWL